MARRNHHYRHSGLRVESALELPEWSVFACEAGGVDVRIELAEGPPDAFPPDPEVECVGDNLRLAIDGIGGWSIHGGEVITLVPELSAQPRELRLFTLGSAWGALGYQRGLAFWHGSAIARGDRAVMIAGTQGAGKSTMAAALLSRGASLVSDDLARVEKLDGEARIWRSSARSKLWREAIEHLGWGDQILERDYFRDDKFHCRVPRLYDGEHAHLAAIILLAEGAEARLERVAGAEAVTQAMQATLYRPEFLDALGAWPGQTALAAQIVGSTPVYRLTRPLDFAHLERACELVEGLF